MKTKAKVFFAWVILSCIALVLSGCFSSHPQDVDNICAIFQQNPSWYVDASRSQTRWGVPMSTMMAIMRQESSFQATIKPPRERLFAIIPWVRPTSADGYSQATYETWWDYQDYTDNFAARRSNFRDAVDFVGWYSRMAHQKLGIPLGDTYGLYLAYHEGLQGYAEGSYKRQAWLMAVARRVAAQANTYHYQMLQCQGSLRSRGLF